jgi:hypothetical protein
VRGSYQAIYASPSVDMGISFGVPRNRLGKGLWGVMRCLKVQDLLMIGPLPE